MALLRRPSRRLIPVARRHCVILDAAFSKSLTRNPRIVVSATLSVVDRARRRARGWTEARYIHAAPLPTVASKSLVSRLLRLSQAKVRSTTQSRGKKSRRIDRSA
jgi:hypothetical protein